MEHFDIVGFATWFAAFLFSTTCHEAAHALLGRLGGDRTAEDQVTLNPLPHIRREPFGMVLLPLLSGISSGGTSLIGWASAPFDPAWARCHPRRAALMSAAGPLANFALAGAAILILRGMIASGGSRQVAEVVWVMALLNALLGVFNLIPLPPLDGAGVVEGLGGPFGRLLRAARTSSLFRLAAFAVAIVVFRFVAPVVADFVGALVTG